MKAEAARASAIERYDLIAGAIIASLVQVSIPVYTLAKSGVSYVSAIYMAGNLLAIFIVAHLSLRRPVRFWKQLLTYCAILAIAAFVPTLLLPRSVRYALGPSFGASLLSVLEGAILAPGFALGLHVDAFLVYRTRRWWLARRG